jgi:hypothetical protein
MQRIDIGQVHSMGYAKATMIATNKNGDCTNSRMFLMIGTRVLVPSPAPTLANS